MKPLHYLTAAAALVALPGAGLAQSGPVTLQNQDSRFDALFTAAADECLDLDKLTGAERLSGCEKALDEVADLRDGSASPSVPEKVNLDLYESLLQIARASAYYGLDKKPSGRVCEAAERSWALQAGLLPIPKSSISAKSYDTIHNVPDSVRPVLTFCRSNFGTPKDAAPLPSA